MIITDSDAGRKRPSFKDRLLFGNTKEALESLVGMPLAEFGRISEVQLPPQVTQFAQDAVAAAKTDFRERWAHFSVDGNQVTTDAQGVGEIPVITESGVRAVGLRQSMAEAIAQRAKAKPTAMLFHNHPVLTPEFVARSEHPTVKFQNIPLTVEQAGTILNLNTPTFSKDDLESFEGNTRLIRTLLLASPAGYRWIVNPNFNIQFPTIVRRSSVDSYGDILKQLLIAAAGRMILTGANEIDVAQYQDKLDQLLTSYCNNSGFALFTNRDIQDPTVRRLNPSIK